MFGTFERSFKLIGESFAVLRKDKELLLFPIISAVVSLLLVITFLVPLLIGMIFAGRFVQPLFWLVLIVLYFLVYFISVFFQGGLIAAANIRLRGGDPKFSDGIRIALKDIHRLFLWALVAATVGILISAIGRKNNMIGRIIEAILSYAWEILTFFVIPVIVLEDKGFVDSTKRSLELFRKAWGETVVGQFSIGAVFGLAGGLGFMALLASLFSGSLAIIAAVFVIVVIYWVALAVVSSTLNGIYKAALYNYAAGRKIKFSTNILKNAFAPKTKNKGL